MPFQKVEYSFPDEEKEDSIAIEDSGEVEIDLSGKKTAEEYANTSVEPEVEVEEPKAEVEIEVIDDTPKADRDYKPSEPPADVTDEELEALALGARMAEAWSDKALGEAARSAMEKIESILPRPLQTAIESTALFAPAGPWTRQYAAGLEVLRKAVSERRKVSFQYTRADGTTSTRTIRPLGLYFWGAKWSLAAWCELRESYRSFRPDRMNEPEVLNERFETTNTISLAGFLEWHLKEENSNELPFVESLAHATESARVS